MNAIFIKRKLPLAILLGSIATANAVEIEEVVVTAQKRAESIQDIGVTVTAFTGDDIKELGYGQPIDIAAQTPGLQAISSGGSEIPVFTIRGVGLDDFNANNASGVAVYIDEVNATSPLYLKGQLFDLERVEVLKGPQGTLYGKNATGGAINYISAQPTDEFSGYVTGGISRWDTYKFEGVINGQLTDGINSRLSVLVENGDGWQEDSQTGEEFGDTDKYAFRWLTSFDIGDNATLLLNLHGSEDQSKPTSGTNIGEGSILATPIPFFINFPFTPAQVAAAYPTEFDVSEVAVGGWDVFRDEEALGGSAKLTIDFDAFTLTSITSYDQYERDLGDNTDGSRFSLLDYMNTDETETFSQELRFTSNSEGPFSWIFGLTYSNYQYEGDTSVFPDDLYRAIISPFLPKAEAQLLQDQESDSYGAYLHTEMELTEGLSLIVGLRYSKDKHDIDSVGIDVDGVFVPPPFGGPGTILTSKDESQQDDNVSGKIGLDYQINDDWLLYANVATGYKAGVYFGAPALVSEAFSYVEPEDVLAYEAGFKGSLLDNSMQLNFSVFRYEYEDRQSLVSGTIGFPPQPFVSLSNVAESETTGAELELRWLPAEGWDLRAGVGYLDTEITDPTVELPPLTVLSVPITKGLDLPSSPQWSYSMVARYEWAMGSLLASVQADFSWIDDQAVSLGDPNALVDERKSLGLRLNIGSAEETWNIALWARNVEDENEAIVGFVSNDGTRGAHYQHPRDYGAEFTYKF